MVISTVESSSSKKIHFRVALKQPEDWKIRSIAEFKRRQALKATPKPAVAAVAAAPAPAPAPAPAVPAARPPPAPPAEKKAGKKAKTDDVAKRSGPAAEKSAAQPAAIAAQQSQSVEATRPEISQQQRQQQLESHLRDLEILASNSTNTRERIRQLFFVRGHLLWLLKKAARHERLMVHEHLSNFAANNI